MRVQTSQVLRNGKKIEVLTCEDEPSSTGLFDSTVGEAGLSDQAIDDGGDDVNQFATESSAFLISPQPPRFQSIESVWCTIRSRIEVIDELQSSGGKVALNHFAQHHAVSRINGHRNLNECRLVQIAQVVFGIVSEAQKNQRLVKGDSSGDSCSRRVLGEFCVIAATSAAQPVDDLSGFEELSTGRAVRRLRKGNIATSDLGPPAPLRNGRPGDSCQISNILHRHQCFTHCASHPECASIDSSIIDGPETLLWLFTVKPT
ncbi:MAG: hypothetical protein ACTMIL_11440 [Brevibacterium aurantiacum]